MSWSTERHLSYNRLYKHRQKLELAKARHAAGLDPRSGLDPNEYIAELQAKVEAAEAEYSDYENEDSE